MAKTLEQLSNKLRIKYIVKAKKYYLYYGSMQIRIDNKYQKGFKTLEEAKSVGIRLKQSIFKDMWYNK